MNLNIFSVRHTVNLLRRVRKIPWCGLLFCIAMVFTVSGSTQAQGLTLVSPVGSTADKAIPSTGGKRLMLKFQVADGIATPKVRIVNDAGVANAFDDYTVQPGGEQKVTLNLLRGRNAITLYGYSGNAENINVSTAPKATLWVVCNDDECGTDRNLIASGSGNLQLPSPGGTTQNKNITIKEPGTGYKVKDRNSIDSNIIVKSGSNVTKVVLSVYNNGSQLDQKLVDVPADGTISQAVKIGTGANTITAFDPARPLDQAFQDSTVVTCEGDCSKSVAESGLSIMQPKTGETIDNAPTVDVFLVIAKGSKLSKLKYETHFKDKIVVADKPITIPAHDDQSYLLKQTVKVAGTGEQTIRFFNADDISDNKNQVAIKITCSGDNCGKGEASTKLTISVSAPKEGETYKVKDISALDSLVTVPKSNITKIQYEVFSPGNRSWRSDEIDVEGAATQEVKVPIRLKFLKGLNTIRIYDVANAGGDNDVSFGVDCTGENCATDFLVSNIPTNSMNTRAVVGMEQVGASSASSETKPFLDFFFTGPIFFDTMKDEVVLVPKLDDKGNPLFEGKVQVMDRVRRPYRGPDGKPIRVPRFGTWGQIRFSTTPQQTAGASVFPSNFVNQVTDPTKVVDLVQSFDYMGGVEFRAFSANGWNWTLIPGVKTKSRLFLTFGAGAISPLNASRAAAQIFKIPTAASPQRAQFVDRFGEPPAGKTYVGFVPLERDRFFRQYYFGIRVKTHYCDDDDCTRFKNSFPAIVDFGVGQNEAVTGGELKQNGKRAWVLRVDAFYPLPLRAASFLYLYGTALMKVGQGGVRIDNPLFLDTAPGDVQITSTDVFIPPPGQQPSRLNRDYYKIGIGVNLTDLFNRNKTPPQ